jgi:hypothetical protein
MSMTNLTRFFPYIIAGSALLVSVIGSYYSISGIGRIFAGHQVGATFMAFALELGNIVTASALKLYWHDLPKLLRNYLCSAVVVLSIITSIGIYGFLSDGYQLTNNKDKIVQARMDLVKKKKERFEIQLADLKKEKEEVNASISNLRKSLSTDNQYQTVDKKGNVLTQIQATQKKGVQAELNISTSKSNDLSLKIDRLNDSISAYDVKIIEIQASNDVSSELGALKYISNITGSSMDVVVNWFLILIMIVFQPLAIALILAALFAFSKKFKDKEELIPVDSPSIPDAPAIDTKQRAKRKYKSKRNKEIDDSEIDSAKTFNIKIEGLEPGEELFPNSTTDTVAEKDPPTDKKVRKRRVVETGLPEDLATHLSESLSKKKD